MASESYTHSYTIIDIGKVLDSFAADFDMVAQSTGLRTRQDVQETSSDVKRMAQHGYLKIVNLYLRDIAGTITRAAKYDVSTNGGSLTGARPGNALWPRTPGGMLCVYVEHNGEWSALSDASRLAFNQSLNKTWGSYALDTSFPRLTRSADRSYVSNGYALTKSVFV
jgi:hypothetical protein